jgi:hypothetical protein
MMCPRFDWNLTMNNYWLATSRFAKQACKAGLGRSVVRRSTQDAGSNTTRYETPATTNSPQ